MPRPRKKRCCRRYRADRVYKPRGVPMKDAAETHLSIDQFEALRLCDSEGLDQTEAGEQMGVSRGTIQRLLYSGRKQLVDALINNHALIVNLKDNEDENVSMHSYKRKRGNRRNSV
ncbi:MAG: DUF134 domain-containing protein [candidate division Zixibacteria bacterium]|nr:DUF134 domain-containing protein [candidate division Zixibacteria bacterium]